MGEVDNRGGWQRPCPVPALGAIGFASVKLENRMHPRRDSAGVGIVLATLAWGLLLDSSARAQGILHTPCSLEELAHLSYADLEQLYRTAQPGAIPCGYTSGRAIYCPDKALSKVRSKITRLVWHGKDFHADGTLVNQWSGVKAIRARVDYGTSWLDGGPSIIMDYRGMSRVWSDVRDELREVAPGLYLGAMYRCRGAEPKCIMYFALEAKPGCN